MELSKRLYAVAGLVTEGASVADIGTDHGYVPIYLVESGIASKVIALDVNQGPLNRARMHIVGHGLGDRIETRLSDGLARICPGEVDTVIASGMGGPLTIRILQEGKEVADQLNALILQPQSEICRPDPAASVGNLPGAQIPHRERIPDRAGGHGAGGWKILSGDAGGPRPQGTL